MSDFIGHRVGTTTFTNDPNLELIPGLLVDLLWRLPEAHHGQDCVNVPFTPTNLRDENE